MKSHLDPDDHDGARDEFPSRRNLFSVTWFRAVVVFSTVGAIAFLTVPYLVGRYAPPVPAAIALQKSLPPGEGPAGEPPKVAEPKAEAKTDPKTDDPNKDGTAPAVRPDAMAAAGRDAYWVQVGAYRDPETARRVATRLRELNFRVEESSKTAAGNAAARASRPAPATAADRYEIIVSGPGPEVNAKIAAKGLASQPGPDGAVITPTLALAEAVAVSKDLTREGLSVRVRRVTPSADPAPSATTTATPTGETWYRVRVGGFSDLAAAQTALRDLEAKGYKPFIARQ